MSPGPPDERVRTVFLGSGRFGRPALERLASHPGIDLAGVITAPPRPSGRRRVVSPTPIGRHAAELGLEPVLTPGRLRAPEAIDVVLALRPELAVLADYGQLVPPALLELRHGALNLHPSALPRWRGAAPIPATILAGDPETAVTLMRMDEGLDTGPIVAQAPVALRGDEVATELEACLSVVAAELLEASLGPWIRGELAPRAQPAEGATLTRPLRREDGRLDPSRSAAELERHVRALLPWPGTFLEADAERLIVSRASVAASAPDDEPGRLVRHGNHPALATADGRLVLEEVTPPGRQRMPGDAWLRGRRALSRPPR
jgi:methionyl-tRNA formyltransferase